ncbi:MULTISPECIES: TIGR01777 family oxidoreductase [unclassified Marinobacterium]|uniref:TIGR01777 family oxidoreductase n=1 Tax=unclassified Marinobacterium TaxID=2644139 RepID=UPI001567F0EC|nr:MULTISPECIES: TIGR01777 family oxidoreductase [unclassified Marinobacterium]NRP09538.1 Epimerase family protein [Marinobacterium sp. xm-g-48]NRP81930.1 Epimerase family protein [Marinobacterium sp. xm-d-509]
MHILLTGGTGFIGDAVARALVARGDRVTLLIHKRSSKVAGVQTISNLSDLNTAVDAIVNLAGLPIADKPWTHSRKVALRASREGVTGQLVRWIAQQEVKPKVLVSGSAIGFYGATRSNQTLSEADQPLVQDFSSELCKSWENIALSAEQEGVRVALLRTGIVLGKGGALKKMLPAFKLGLGGRIVDGQQMMSWIHLDDQVNAILFLIDNPDASGPFNLTAPNPVSNQVFTEELGRVLKRPTFFPMPAFMPKLMLGKEGAALLTEGVAVIPAKLTQHGFDFKYPSLDQALTAVI